MTKKFRTLKFTRNWNFDIITSKRRRYDYTVYMITEFLKYILKNNKKRGWDLKPSGLNLNYLLAVLSMNTKITINEAMVWSVVWE